jgi:aromatic-L-amino-acid/L-tryptophan decarboxylase
MIGIQSSNVKKAINNLYFYPKLDKRMNTTEFRRHAHEMADYIADYYENLEKLPVKSMVSPGDILKALPESAPGKGEDFAALMNDFNKIVLPGITHWQHPNFFAYFPANSSYPSVLAEMLTAALGSQCMVWETSPAAAELEEKMMEWLKNCMGLPYHFHGVIQDSASTSTLVAILSAREKISEYAINSHGFAHNKFRVYCSTEAHSSVDKAVKIAGLGLHNLVKIPVDQNQSMRSDLLKEFIINDRKDGFIPLSVVAAIGTTSTCAIDPLTSIAEICQAEKLWLHVDAAYAGTSMLIPEYRKNFAGLEYADSYVFNPHKWMFSNFDCSAYFVKDKDALIRTFEILPEYLKTRPDSQVNNYRDWGIQLGRRFRALKLWFVMRSFGIEAMQEKIMNHITWARYLAREIKNEEGFELFEPQNFALLCFRLHRGANLSMENEINEKFLYHLNSSGKLYLSHTRINGVFLLRLQIGQTYVTFEHIQKAWDFIKLESRNF